MAHSNDYTLVRKGKHLSYAERIQNEEVVKNSGLNKSEDSYMDSAEKFFVNNSMYIFCIDHRTLSNIN
ncbi:hypothetical protein SAMN04488569_10397 [Marinilactibacillus piezotolerans]|uniref:Uncharacterized protein n=1 Tax=Marinilactibacillus piezotolerans TaxID=258723 RepID=A0A1I3ZV77_9LACT|nr:hypothetical protein [Marinilactibacillus piezotolerans]SFK47837.1 hypothetical protein SAMN04488569_10397 [Marinilactibacillus piezotolerans]